MHRVRFLSQKFFQRGGLSVLLLVLVAFLLSRWHAHAHLERTKQQLLEEHRARTEPLGSKWSVLRETLETAVWNAGTQPWPGDFVDPALAGWDFRTQPGLYLHVRQKELHNQISLRTVATGSFKDSLLACMLGRAHPLETQRDRPAHVWNVRQLYDTTRILEPPWAQEVQRASTELRLRVFARQYAQALQHELPLAEEILGQATFFLFVLEEEPQGSKPHETSEEVARMHLVHLGLRKEMLRARRHGNNARILPMGRPQAPEIQAAILRQVRGCALAGEILRILPP